MIESLTLKNFQPFDFQRVEFSPGVTTLVGPTDSGKSAILRAIRLLALGRPNVSADFVKWGSKGFVLIFKVDGKRIKRSRRKNKNVYTLGDQQLVAFGSTVPDTVADVLNLSDLNFQLQLDPPFWLTESPGQLSKKLNQIINLDAIDRSLGFIHKKAHHLKVEVDIIRQQKQQAKEALEKVAWVKDCIKPYNGLVQLEHDIHSTTQKVARLHILCGSYDLARQARLKAEECVKGAIGVTTAHHRLTVFRTSASRLRMWCIKGRYLNEQTITVPDITELARIRKRADQTAERRCTLAGAIHDYTFLKDQKCLLDKTLLELKAELKAKSKNLICPTCKQPLQSPSQSSAQTFTYPPHHRCVAARHRPNG